MSKDSQEDSARERLHTAIRDLLDESEIPVCWCLTIDVAGPESRYIAHRSGGGHDGNEHPTLWAAVGMLQTSADLALAKHREICAPIEGDIEESGS